MKLRFALGKLTLQLLPKVLEKKQDITAHELREFVRKHIEDNCIKYPNCRKFWQPLTEIEKNDALQYAIPDNVDSWVDYPNELLGD